MSHLRLRLLAAVAALVALAGAGNALAAGGVVISQVYGGGGNSGATLRNDFIELFNSGSSSVSIAGWTVQYASSAGASWQTTPVAGSLAPGQHYLVQEAAGAGGTTNLPTPDATGSIAMSGTAGKVALVKNATALTCGATPGSCLPSDSIADFVGYGTATDFEGSAATVALTNTTAALRAAGGCTDTDQNGADFSTGAPAPRNTASPLTPCGGPPVNQPVTATCGPAMTVLQGTTATQTVTATDPDGTVLGFTATLSPAPAPGTIAITSQVAATADGGAATATITVSGNVPPGAYTVEVTASNDDVVPQTSTCSFVVTVTGVKPIGEIQGPVGATANGLTHRSPFASPTGNGTGLQTVVVRGVIYQKTLARTAAGAGQNGFFIQNTASQADSDPTTSDGLFVFMGGFTTLIGGYAPQVGDEVVISGRVSEFFNLTQLSSARLEVFVASALDVDVVLPAIEADPPNVLDEANRYWERLEDMRLRVPAGSLVTDGLDSFPATTDTEMWVIRGDSEIAHRTGYARRVFRDAHPLDNLPGLFDDGNGFRILIGPIGLKAVAGDNTALLPPSRTFDTVTNSLVGGLNFSFNKYRIETTVTPSLEKGIDPALNAPPTPGNRFVQYNVGDYNVENLYDYRDDPFDGCDFAGNSGCPGVNPPFDYVPASDAVYQERLGQIAQQVTHDIHSPDILLVQEAEDQDICSVVAGALSCGTADDADGKPDTLQELALRISSLGGPAYDAAYDRDGSDDRGIVAALLYRTDRVELLPPTADHPVLGSSPEIDYRVAGNAYNADVENPKSLNAPLPTDIDRSTGTDGSEVYTRDPQVGLFRVWRTAVGIGAWTDVVAISNHFSSTPDRRIGQRREQAAYLAAIVKAFGHSARVVAGGDFNVYPRPDDPVQPPSDQLGPLYDSGLANLWDTLVAQVPAAAYSYVFVGQAQTLDGQFVTPNLLAELKQTRVAHVNADFPADFPADGARGLSDHDPLASRFALPVTLAGLQALVAYYCESGAITGSNTCRQLQHHLDRSKTVGDAQLRAFIDQVRDKTPRFITRVAADALIAEAKLLLRSN
ncbi:MAG: lamin tail domain-containing protein [Actinobacteria bacterium]|nr:lamin tail domain-containing protein [Actinomycetota bacterium]